VVSGEESVGTTWANSYAYSAGRVAYPTDVAALQGLVRSAAPHTDVSARSLRALGSRHSFTDVADSMRGGTLVSVERFDPNLVIDGAARTATFAAGWRYGELSRALHEQGWALHNMASLPHISVAGAVSTSTHGSGDGNGTLASSVRAIEFVNGLGEVVRLRQGVDPDFEGAVVSMGCLGILTRLTLAIEPTFSIRQDVYDHVRWTQVLQHFDAMTTAAYSVSMFTTWGSDDSCKDEDDEMGMLWLKSRVDRAHSTSHAHPPDELFGARRETLDRHPVRGVCSSSTTPQVGVAGPWSERLSHFRLEFTPSAGEELQSEYMLPRANALRAIAALRSLKERIKPLLFVSEIRIMRADKLWLSSAYAASKDDPFAAGAVAFHFTWKPLPVEVRALLPAIEAALLPLGARPHWGKLFLAGPSSLRAAYPRWDAFRSLVLKHDPQGLFRNEWTASKLGLSPLVGGEQKVERASSMAATQQRARL